MAVSKENKASPKAKAETKPGAVSAEVAKPVVAEAPKSQAAAQSPAVKTATVKTAASKTAPAREPVAKRAAPKKAAAKEVAPVKAASVKPAAPKPVAKKPAVKKAAAKPATPKTETPSTLGAPAIGTEIFSQSFQNTFELPTTQLEDMFKMNFDMFKNYEDVAAFNKSNVEAAVKSGNIFAKGVQDMGTTVVGLFQASFEESVSNAKAMMECKSAQDLAVLQTEIASSAYDKFMAEGSKISEATAKVAEDVAAPLTERFNATVEVFNKVKAA